MLESQQTVLPVGAWDSTCGNNNASALSELSLIEAQTIPIFEEATQTAAYLLDFTDLHLGFSGTASGLSQQVYHGWTDESIGTRSPTATQSVLPK